MYVITQHNKILLGPIEWNPSYISSVLQNDLDLSQRPTILPSDMFKVPYYILPEIYVRNAVINKPEYNPKIQKFGGTTWAFDEKNAYATFTIVDKDLDEVKGELKNVVSSNRWTMENAGTNILIGSNNLRISTNREQRRVYVDKLAAMDDGDQCMWKFEEDWISLSKQNILEIVKAIDTAVQEAFDWEIQKCNEINSCTTLDQLDKLELNG
jgi:hypothetical protein